MQTHDHKFSFEMFICVLGGYEKLKNRFTRRDEKINKKSGCVHFIFFTSVY